MPLAAAGRPAQRQPDSLPPLAPVRRASPPRTRSRSLTASTARWGVSMSWTGRCRCSASPPIRHHHPPPSCWRGCATAAPSPSSFASGEQIARVDYGENDHCCQNFALVAGWLDAKGLQRRGVVGHAGARLVRSRDIVETVVERLRAEETIFLHPYGVDEECDEARASIPF